MNVRVICPLARFQSEVDFADFGNGVFLRALEREETKEVASWFGVPAMVQLGFQRFALYSEGSVESHLPDPELLQRLTSFAEGQICDVVSGLRLVRSGGVYAAMRIAWLEPKETVRSQLPLPLRIPLASFRRSYPTYALKRRDLAVVVDLLPRMQSLSGNVRVALECLNQACERERETDKVIDLCTAMEALFGDSGDSLSFKVCLRMARYVGPNPFQRRRIFNFSRITYDIRSAIVHGRSLKSITGSLSRQSPAGKHKYGFANLSECANATEDWVRASIRKAVREGKPDLGMLDMEAVAAGDDDGDPSVEIR